MSKATATKASNESHPLWNVYEIHRATGERTKLSPESLYLDEATLFASHLDADPLTMFALVADGQPASDTDTLSGAVLGLLDRAKAAIEKQEEFTHVHAGLIIESLEQAVREHCEGSGQNWQDVHYEVQLASCGDIVDDKFSGMLLAD